MSIAHRPIDAIKPSPENEKLYRPVRDDDPDIIALAESIREHGLREPLVITRDNFILSGHRRYAACRLAGLTEVPVRVEKFRRSDDLDGFLALLREHNRQRVKSLDEMLREEVTDCDPDEAHARLVEYREGQQKPTEGGVALGCFKGRSAISAAKRPMLEAAMKIIEDLRPFWPASLRQIHYGMLNDPPLRNANRPESTYRNDRASYGDLSDLLTRARFEGLVSIDTIDDETRPTTTWDCHPSPDAFVRAQLDGFLKSYWRDLTISQPAHVEIIAEKNTVKQILRPVASEFTVPLTCGRGFGSVPMRREIVERFEVSGKDRLILIVASDADPEGEAIASQLGQSIRDDLGIHAVEVVKAALTPAQAREMNLPATMTAKAGSSNRARFVKTHGCDDVWELEAIPPGELQKMVRDAILRVLDIEMLNLELRREHEDAAWLDQTRQRVYAALQGIEGGLE